jgi:hypothetical protein
MWDSVTTPSEATSKQGILAGAASIGRRGKLDMMARIQRKVHVCVAEKASAGIWGEPSVLQSPETAYVSGLRLMRV